MEIHLKIKRSKKELEALENQEKEVSENRDFIRTERNHSELFQQKSL